MLDHTKNERVCIGATELEWLVLSGLERRLIALYRQLSEKEQCEIRRLSEVLATNPEELIAT